MNPFDFDPFNSKKLDPRKYGYDYGSGMGPIVFNSNLFKECSSCKGTGEIEIKEGKTPKIEKCLDCDGTGAVPKDIYILFCCPFWANPTG